MKPGEEWDQNGQPIVVTSTNARQIIDGTRALESGLTSNVKSVDELGPSAWLETADRGRAQTSLFCLGKNGSIVVVQLFNASAKPDDQAADAITVAKALQQISA